MNGSAKIDHDNNATLSFIENADWLSAVCESPGLLRCINNDTVGKGRVLRKHLGMTSRSGLEGRLCTASLYCGVTDRLFTLSALIGQI